MTESPSVDSVVAYGFPNHRDPSFCLILFLSWCSLCDWTGVRCGGDPELHPEHDPARLLSDLLAPLNNFG